MPARRTKNRTRNVLFAPAPARHFAVTLNKSQRLPLAIGRRDAQYCLK
jgi:hypothetical protein